MSFAGPYGQAQGASPWSAGIPPGQQGPGQANQPQQPNNRQPQQVPQQPMFQQPMGAFDIASAWQAGQQQAAAQQWATMQQVQFVPNPAFMQQQQAPVRDPRLNQRGPMHQQRSLSASRAGGFGNQKRSMNQNNNFGGPQGQQQQQNWQRNNNNNNNNNNNQYQSRVGRQQQARNNNNQRGQQSNNNNNNINNNHNNNNNGRQNNNNNGQQQQRQQNQQQPQQQQQQQQKSVRKVTKVRKQNALRSKLKSADPSNKSANETGTNASGDSNNNNAASAASKDSNQESGDGKPQSKTAERKQFKLQARRNAESIKQSKLPVVRPTPKVEGDSGAADKAKLDEPIDQAQLKCVPAVFGFVCKLCDVFLRDKVARREHIDSTDHMEKFKEFEEREKLVAVKQEPEQATPAGGATENQVALTDSSKTNESTLDNKSTDLPTTNSDEAAELTEQESADNAGLDSDSQVKEEPVVG